MMNDKKPTYAAITGAEAVAEPMMVEVTAPATLKAGYVFRATYSGTIFDVVVPAGGVVEGQNLVVPFNRFNPNTTPGSGEVVGYWKDDLCACTRYGLFHPSLLNACCIPLVLLGQIETRLKLNWSGNPAPAGEWSKTFKTMAYLTVTFMILSLILSPPSPKEEGSVWYNLLNFSYGLLMLVILSRVRKIVRTQNGIPEMRCIGCEDVCCAFWCVCCTVSQLARQTADYDIEDARFFTNNGLETTETAPAIIV